MAKSSIGKDGKSDHCPKIPLACDSATTVQQPTKATQTKAKVMKSGQEAAKTVSDKLKDTKADSKNLINKALTALRTSSKGGAQQLFLGTVSGWTTGYLITKVGKPVALTVGGSIILFQFAQHQKLIDTDWDKIKHKMENTSKKLDISYKAKSPQWKANAQRFARTNTCFAAGFVGGFLIGLAS